jgi:hypothetical protein
MQGPQPYQYSFADYLVKVNGSTIYTSGCGGTVMNLQFIVIDSMTGEPWKNALVPATGKGRFGSIAPCRIKPNGVDFEDPFF